VMRPVVATTFTGVGTSDPGVWATGISPSFPTALAIKAGDFVGLQSPNSNLILSNTATASSGFWHMTDLLPDGTTRAANGTGMNREVNVQAVIEPDVDCDRLGDETQDGAIRQGCMAKVLSGVVTGTTLNLSVQCPSVTQACDANQVSLVTSGPVTIAPPTKKKKAAASAKKKKKKKKKPVPAVVTIGSASFSIPAGQTQTVPVTLVGNAVALFRVQSSVSATATVTGSGRTLTEPVTITATPQPTKKKKKRKKKK
jgi:hypothetical protein